MYDLGAQSHLKVSCEEPGCIAQTDGISTFRIVEAIRTVGLEKTLRFHQTSTSELFGFVQELLLTRKQHHFIHMGTG